MLFLKSTMTMKAPGIYEVDIAAKPPGKTFGVFLAIHPDQTPTELLAALEGMGFKNTKISPYTHKDRGKVVDLHYQKDGTDLFHGWKDAEREANLSQLTALFATVGVAIVPRVMELAEAYA